MFDPIEEGDEEEQQPEDEQQDTFIHDEDLDVIEESDNEDNEQENDKQMLTDSLKAQISAQLTNHLKTEIATYSADTSLDDNDSLIKFMEEFLDNLLVQCEDFADETTLQKEDVYKWMTQFYMQFCGYQFYLSTLHSMGIVPTEVATELATMISDLVDEIAENADFLHYDSNSPEYIAKSVLWKLLNSNKLRRRYWGILSEGEIVAGDILDDLIEDVKGQEMARLIQQLSDKTVSRKSGSSVEANYWVLPPVCEEFMGVFDLAEQIIQHMAEEAERKTKILECGKIIRIASNTLQVKPAQIKIFTYKFPKIGQFTVCTGATAIEGYISTWKTQEDWKVAVEYLSTQSDFSSDYYFYVVNWSLPTKLYPIAQATASVIFRIEICKMKPPTCPVNVSYKFEGRSLIHQPGMMEFRESWLIEILQSKIALFKMVRF